MIRVIGFGNPFQGDDGFGPAVAAALASRPSSSAVSVVEGGAPGLGALALFEGCATVMVVDALRDGGLAGEVGWLAPEDITALVADPLHGGGLTEMLRALPLGLTGEIPSVFVLLGRIDGIQPFCEGLTEPLLAAVPRAVDLIEAKILALRKPVCKESAAHA